MTERASWRPSASADAIRARARLYTAIREFFAERSVLEVETPLLAAGPAPDPFIENLELQTITAGTERRLFLQTSPELAMKRMLAAGSGSIYQICKAFRAGEVSRQHNPEFTMLEWYRVGWDHHELMREVAELITRMCQLFDRPMTGQRELTYPQLFREVLGIDPLTATRSELDELLLPSRRSSTLDRDDVLGLLLTDHIEPGLDRDALLFVYDFPESQAALAKVTQQSGRPVAQRFEAYFGGYELANGYHELTDPAEQRKRLTVAEEQREAANLPPRPVDQRFLRALDAGLPDCAGVALGVDRLLMALLDEESVEAVVTFTVDRA